MKVLNLRCANGHGFEGWFASEDDFLAQNGRHAIQCPMCADAVISRLPSAPRLNLSGAREPQPMVAAGAVVPAPPAPPAVADADLQARWLRAARELMARTEDVGERFAEEARRIHYGEADARGIRGVASADEVRALHDEGIAVAQLPLPAALKEPLQ